MTNDSTSDNEEKTLNYFKLDSGPEGLPNKTIENVNDQARFVAPFPVKVLLLGKSGTGKSMLARYIHAQSGRKYRTVCKKVWEGIHGTKLKEMLAWAAGDKYHKKENDGKEIADTEKFANDLGTADGQNGIHLKNQIFREINLAALPEQTVSSELFGYVEGAFTDANEHGSPGLFIQANGGTLFLDEIADCPPSIQAKLLTVIQPRRDEDEDGDCPCYVIPNGQEEEVRVNVRLICATNKNLEDEIKANRFRSDLYYRIKEYVIKLPSLQDLYAIFGRDKLPKGYINKILGPNIQDDPHALSDTQWESIQAKFYLCWFIQEVLEDVNTKLSKASKQYKRNALDSNAFQKLLDPQKYSFDGNYRELQSCIMQACLNTHARVMADQEDGDANEDYPDLDEFDLNNQELIQENDIPDELLSAPNYLSGKEEKCLTDTTDSLSSHVVDHMDNGDQRDFEHALSCAFTTEEKECISKLLIHNVCSREGLMAVIKRFKFDKGKSHPRRDFSDIRSFLFFIGCIEKEPTMSKPEAVQQVFGSSDTGKIDRVLKKFGINFEFKEFKAALTNS